MAFLFTNSFAPLKAPYQWPFLMILILSTSQSEQECSGKRRKQCKVFILFSANRQGLYPLIILPVYLSLTCNSLIPQQHLQIYSRFDHHKCPERTFPYWTRLHRSRQGQEPVPCSEAGFCWNVGTRRLGTDSLHSEECLGSTSLHLWTLERIISQ